MAWWRNARFGMFVHWGLYSTLAGSYKGQRTPGLAEWIMHDLKIPVADYEPLMHQFDPVKFSAERWVRMAKNAGMKYIVITSKHHEGFNMFDSHESNYNIMNTPFHRDVMTELAAACREEGIRFCFYHSIMDWHHPDYAPRRPWDPRPGIPTNMDRYVAYLKAELKELLTHYGPIGVLWFDGEWEDTWNHARGKDLYNYVRSLQPSIIVNNRVDKGRNGMQGMNTGEEFAGDFGTPEQEIPPNGVPGIDWESCMTMNDTWGYNKDDHNWKSSETLIKDLVDIASKGGNFLLNVGPTGEGLIPDAIQERLKAMGAWMKKNGEAIYGTEAGPFPKPLPWGRVTQKPGRLYLCVFAAENGDIVLPGFSAKIKRVFPLGSRERSLPFGFSGEDVVVHIGKHKPNPVDVYVMEISGRPKVTILPVMQHLDGTIYLRAEDADIHGSTARVEADKHAIGYWTDASDWVSWKVRVKKPGRFQAVATIACEPASAGSAFTFSIGGSEATATVPNTGSWTNFIDVPLGQVDAPSAGDLTLSVHVKTKPGEAVMNLRRIVLRLSGSI